MRTQIFIFLVCLAGFAVAEPVPVNGPVTDVIVYRGQALVTRSLNVEGAGDIELLIEDLPERIIPESLYAQSDASVSVLSVRYREKVIEQDNRKEVKELEEKIYQMERDMIQLTRDHDNAIDRIDRFREQWKLNIDAANADLNRGLLQPEKIVELTTYLENKSKEQHKEIMSIENAKLDLEKQKEKAVKELEELKKGQQKAQRQALVYLNKPDKKAVRVLLSYLVNGANWSPQYNLKALPKEDKASVEYNAVVQQSSGEDWNNIALALSTAQPSMVASPAELVPMQVTLSSGVQRMVQGGMQQAVEMSMEDKSGLGFVDQSGSFDSLLQNRKENIAKGVKAQRELNQIAIGNQMIELEADRRMLGELKEKAAAIVRAEGISVLYSLKGKLTLPSRSDQQMVNIASFGCPAQFVFAASPLLTDYVYLQGQMTNTSETILLPGPASMFRDGQFVGKGDIKLVTSGQTFTAGFGIDSQIQVVRDFTDKKTDTLLGSRQNQQHYRIAISNYKKEPVKLRLFERIPWTENPSLSIELKDVSHPLSEDPEYLRTERPKGILRWDLELKPESFATGAQVITYSYIMKYDKSMTVAPVVENR